MAFGITGFGAQGVRPAPQVFQALSIERQPPVPPAPPYGTPNPNLVPVGLTGNPALPANLTLAAHPAFSAILKVNSTAVLAYGHPAIPPTQNTTSSVGATNPTVAGQVQGPAPPGIPTIGSPPQGPISFSLTAPAASATVGLNAVQTTAALLAAGQKQFEQAPAAGNPSQNAAANAPAGNAGGNSATSAAPADPPQTGTPAPDPAPSGGAPSTAPATGSVPVASPALVGKIVQTVQALAVAAVYPGPVFSFSA